MDIIIYILVFIFGLLIGSFLNVCIYRIPKGETIVTGRSHCMNCNQDLRWYDLLPLVSFLLLGGKCRYCKTKLPAQYPIIELVNGLFYVLVFYIHGWQSSSIILLNIIYTLSISVLIVVSVIDYRTYTIPGILNKSLLVLSFIAVIIKYFGTDRSTSILLDHIIGFFAISTFLAIIFYLTNGRGIGGGDVKLMASAGLLLGWKLVILSFILGAVFAAVIHILKMRLMNAENTLAFGPYLSAGIVVSLLFGNDIINWYINYILSI